MKVCTVIIHGWSDCSKSFKELKAFLIQHNIGSVETIYYADYESREDNISFEDVIDGLYDRFKEKGFIDKSGNKLVDLNVIVHSTGGLIIRHFISEYYINKIDKCPVRKILMLAPANFGSPLAHYGKSILGMIFRGRYKFGDLFEVGRRLLSGLEIASPYQWHLAHRDIITDEPYYLPDKIQTFIFIGAQGYKGLKKIISKKGTDGTVVVSGANINSVKFTVDFTCEGQKISYMNSGVDVAFAVLKDYNHGTIVEDIKPNKKSQIGKLLLQALKIKTTNEFNQFKKKLEGVTKDTFKNKEIYQQFFIHAVDDHGKPVKDYTIEFFIYKYDKKYLKNGEVIKKRLSMKEIYWGGEIHRYLTDEFHKNSTDPSFRRFIVGVKGFGELLKSCCQDLSSDIVLSVRIHVPRIDEGIYYDTKKLKNIILLKTENRKIPRDNIFFSYPNTTTLMELKVNRSTKYVTVRTKPRRH